MKRLEKTTQFGFFNVDKPSGFNSSAVVNKCKWLTGVPCGHMGTLDPLASGVLPIGIGNATRLFDYFLQKQKEYVAEFTFGVTSNTLDSTGELVYGGDIPTEKEIQAVIPSFIGTIEQIPPKYSAKNINGRRCYDLAREGVDFEIPAKCVQIDDIQMLGRVEEKENTYRFKILCGGGTYIRSIARDIALALSTNAVMSALRRTKSGIFTIENTIPFSLLQEDLSLEELEKYIIPTQQVLPFEPLLLDEKDSLRIFQGQMVKTDTSDGLYKLYQAEKFYGIAEVKDGYAKAKTKLC